MRRFTLLLFLFPLVLHAGDTLSLSELLQKIRLASPALELQKSTARIAMIRRSNIGSKNLPQVSLQAQSTYQSETTGLDISFPGFSIPRLSRDQYRLQTEISQNLYDGGALGTQKELASLVGEADSLQREVELEQTTEFAIQAFFQVLELQERRQLVQIKQTELDTLWHTAKIALQQGVLLEADILEIEAERIQLGQRGDEILIGMEILIEQLEQLVGDSIDREAQFLLPKMLPPSEVVVYERPSFSLIEISSRKAQLERQLEKAMAAPRLGLFLQAGYGKPGLNFLKNEFTSYYLAGLRLQWNISEYYNSTRNNQLLRAKQEQADILKRSLHKNVEAKRIVYRNEMVKYNQWLKDDGRIREHRRLIRDAAYQKWILGVLTSSEYLPLTIREMEARLNERLHYIQYIKSRYMLDFQNGNASYE